MDQADTGQYLVDATAKFLQHDPRLGKISRLAKDSPVQGNDGIGPQNDGLRKSRPDLHRLALRIQEAKLTRCQALSGKLLDPGCLDLKINPRIAQELAPARRSRRQDQNSPSLKQARIQANSLPGAATLLGPISMQISNSVRPIAIRETGALPDAGELPANPPR
jgi:hypothetical protein